MIVVACSAFAFGGFLWFGERNLGTGLVRSQLCGALTSVFGDSVEVGEVTGNFLIGYRVDGLRLSCSDGEAFSAERARIKIDLSSILRGRPAAKELVIAECTVDSTRLRSLLKLGKSSGGAPPVEQLSFRNVTVSYPMGEVFFEDVLLTLEADGMDAAMEGKINGIGFQGKLFIKRHTSGTGASLERLSLKFASGGEVALSGDLLPDLDLVGLAQGITHEALLSLFPRLAAADPHGVLDTELCIAGSPRQATVEGKITSANGRIAGFPIESAKASWQLVGRSLRFFDLNALTFGSPLSGEISFDLSMRPIVMKTKLSGEGLDTDKWKARFGWLSFAKGVADSIETDLSGALWALSGDIKVNAKSLDLAGYKIDELKTDLYLTKGKEIKVKGSAKWLGAPLKAQGIVDITNGKTNLDLEVTLKGLPLNGLAKRFNALSSISPEGLVDSSLRLKGFITDLAIEGSVRSAAIKVLGERLERFDMSFGLFNGDLSVKSLSARWNGTIVSASGAFKELPSGNPSLQMQGKASRLSIAALKSKFKVPEGLSGEFETSWSLSGTSKTPFFSVDAVSNKVLTPLGVLQDANVTFKWEGSKAFLDLKGKIYEGNVDLSGQILPDVAVEGIVKGVDLKMVGETFSLPLSGIANGHLKAFGALSKVQWNFELETEESFIGPAAIDMAKISFFNKDKELNVKMDANILGGSTNVAGLILLSEKKIALEGNFSDVEVDSKFGLPFRGALSGKIAINGGIASPEIRLEGNSPELGIRGFYLSDATFALVMKGKSVTIETIKGHLGESPFEASGAVTFEEGALNISVSAKRVDIASALKDKSGLLRGEADVSFFLQKKGRDGFSGSGRLYSKELSTGDFSLHDVDVPFSLNGSEIIVKDGKGLLYGGESSIQGSFDMTKRVFKTVFETRGLDLKVALVEALHSKGSISGKADLLLNMEGSVAGRLFLRGIGQLNARDSELYKSLSITFAFDNEGLYIFPGSRVSAPVNSPLYRYITADGGITKEAVDLNCHGNINIKALNALVGALKELSQLAQSSQQLSQEGLAGLLAGFFGGITTKEFQEVSFHLGGRPDKLYLHNLQVYKPTPTSPLPYSSMGPDRRGHDDTDKIEITLSFSQGGGGSGDQITGQLLEQLLKQLLKPKEP